MSASGPPPLAGVIGRPIEHSRSPALFAHWLEAHGLRGHYVPFEVAPEQLAEALAALMGLGFRGVNVTVPLKEAALALADEASERAHAIGAANTLTFREGRIEADNTDGHGFLANLREGAPDWDPASGPAAVLGAGGAARAVLAALLEAGVPEIRLANRTRARAEGLAAAFGPRVSVRGWDGAEAMIEGASLLVNATSLGMAGAAPLDVALDALEPATLVTDLVYAPLETPLLRAARARGCRTVDGLGMLIHQAAPNFVRWFGGGGAGSPIARPRPAPKLSPTLASTPAPTPAPPRAARSSAHERARPARRGRPGGPAADRGRAAGAAPNRRRRARRPRRGRPAAIPHGPRVTPPPRPRRAPGCGPHVIALTGSIGMGKSATAALFAEAGIPAWDADAAVARLYGPGGAGARAIAPLRPLAVRADGAIDREALRAWMAADPGALPALEARVHPLVAEDRAAFLAGARAPVVLLDVPLLFEAGLEWEAHTVVVVSAPPEVQRARVLAREGMTPERLDVILARQMPDAEKRARADHVIETATRAGARAGVARVLEAVRRGLGDA